jgi:NAD(P)H-dependent flavin oxidoreductase YrpB (nitropropane dioxygenase family)
MAISTRLTEALGIAHPIALGGMGSIYAPALAAEVSAAGGLGAIGASHYTVEQLRNACRDIRKRTDRPYAANFLLFDHDADTLAAALDERPPVIAYAWPRKDQELKPFFDLAHRAGAKITFMASSVHEAKRAADAGADVLIAQGTEGGGHVSWIATMALVPMVVDACPGVPVMAAGGIADGRGLAAALALGADGALMGTRFLATEEAPLHASFKQAILDSDGHDTLLTEIPDLAMGMVWPGAMSRTRRNRFIERWAGREWQIRHMQKEVLAGVQEARKRGDAEEAPLSYGQDAGLVHDLPKAGELVRRIAAEAEEILRVRLPGMLR